jgi:putative acetyltransferase
MEMTIRPIEPADNAALAKIIRSSLLEFGANKPGTVFFDPTTDALAELFRQKGAAYFVATENGKILGGAGVYPTPGLPEYCCELVKMYLCANARGKGLGGKLIAHSLETAASLGYRQVYLETMPELRKAVSVYEKFGFQYLEAPMGNSGHFGCDVWMIKALSTCDKYPQ